MKDFNEVYKDASAQPSTNPALVHMQTGKRYVMHVHPGWIFTGKVVHADETRVELQDAVYTETIANGKSCFDLAACKTAQEVRAVSPIHFTIPNNLVVSGGKVVLFVECDGGGK